MSPRVAVIVFPGIERRPRCSARPREARSRCGARLARRRTAPRCGCRDPARRLFVRRLPALRGDRAIFPGDARRRLVRCRRWTRARHLQRVPDPVRGGTPPRRPPPEHRPVVRLPGRSRTRLPHGHAVHAGLHLGPAARDPRQARRGLLPPRLGTLRTSRSSFGTRRAPTRTARSTISPAWSTSAAT